MILLQVLAFTLLGSGAYQPVMHTYQFHTVTECQIFRGQLVSEFSYKNVPNKVSLCQVQR